MRPHGPGLALPVLGRSAGQRLLARRLVPEAQDGRCGQGPRELGLAALRAGGPLPLARRCLGACDEPAGGHANLAPWEARDSMHGIHEHETEDRGTVWSKDRGWASCCCAVVTMANPAPGAIDQSSRSERERLRCSAARQRGRDGGRVDLRVGCRPVGDRLGGWCRPATPRYTRGQPTHRKSLCLVQLGGNM
jgi:hypothetical protein